MKHLDFSMIVLMISTIAFSCSSNKISSQTTKKEMDFSSPPTIIYKTNNDYSKFVPVTLSDDKSKIVSYPSPKDIYCKGKLAYPTKLKNGYYLDNRGINKNSVFLNITYEEYSKFKEVPPLKELYLKISNKNPFTEFYDCGNRFRFKNEIKEINKIIKSNKLKECKCLTEQIK